MRAIPVWLGAGMLCGSSLATAQDVPAEWVKRPSAQDIMGVFPKAARGPGEARIACTVTVHGTLRACRVDAENPSGQGFGQAALALTPQLLFKPAQTAGRSVESTVRIPIRFYPQGIMGEEPETGSRVRRNRPDPMETDTVVSGFFWVDAPTVTDLAAAYPEEARETKQSGFATLTCRIRADRKLDNCETLREEPRNASFARAARSLIPKFLAPVLTDPAGKPVSGPQTQILFTFSADALTAAKPVIGRPKYSVLPDIGDLAAVLPAQAREKKIFKARVVMNCTVGARGALDGCEARSEEPTGLGYGEAAVRLSKTFRLTVWTEEGLPTVGGQVSVPIRFDLEDYMRTQTAPAAPSGPATTSAPPAQ